MDQGQSHTRQPMSVITTDKPYFAQKPRGLWLLGALNRTFYPKTRDSEVMVAVYDQYFSCFVCLCEPSQASLFPQ